MSEDIERIYYVYEYVCPIEGEVMYIGHGTGDRAWQTRYMRGDTKKRHDWKTELLQKGYVPSDWVNILDQRLTKKEAKEIEKELIEMWGPPLNVLHNKTVPHPSSTFHVHKKEWEELKNTGLSYNKIAEKFKVATMTVWRHLNG